LGGVDEPQKFLRFEALRHLDHEILQLGGGFAKLALVILLNRRLKLAL
jgi:hypothetical protein